MYRLKNQEQFLISLRLLISWLCHIKIEKLESISISKLSVVSVSSSRFGGKALNPLPFPVLTAACRQMVANMEPYLSEEEITPEEVELKSSILEERRLRKRSIFCKSMRTIFLFLFLLYCAYLKLCSIFEYEIILSFIRAYCIKIH